MAADELLDTPVELLVDVAGVGQRLDAFLADRFARHSRVQLRRAISAGSVTVDGKHPKAAYRLRLGERIRIVAPEVPRQCAKPEDIPLDVLYEDDWLMAVNKPPGMVVHPARGHWKGTLASALAHHCDQLSTIGGPARPGIVHRLDRDTSGVIVVAKNDRAHLELTSQFERRTTEKEYLAIIVGTPDRDRDIVNQPIGVHPYQREKMAIRAGHYDHAASGDVLRGPAAVSRFRPDPRPAQNGTHAPDPPAPGPHRLPRPVRPAVRRPRANHPGRDHHRPRR